MTESTLPNTNAGAPAGTDPNTTPVAKTTETPGATNTFDPSKIPDEQFDLVFNDPRLFKHQRFQQLNQRAKQADEFEAKQKEAEDAKLKEQAKWQELAEKKEQEVKTWQEKYTGRTIDNAIQLEASKAGAVDVEAVLKLIDRSKLVVADDGTVNGVADAVSALISAKPYLKNGTAPTKIGDATNPGGASSQAPKTFKASQLSDVKFYRENEKDIMTAMRLGLIENDLAK